MALAAELPVLLVVLVHAPSRTRTIAMAAA